MLVMIERLTQEQIDKFPSYVKKWTDIGLSTEKVDRKKAEEAINLFYKCGGLDHPKKIIWLESPLGIYLYLLAIDNLKKDSRDSVRDSIRDSIRDAVWDSVRGSVRDSVRDAVWDSVRDAVWDAVRDAVWDSVRGSVRDAVRGSVGGSVWDAVRDAVRGSVGGSVWDSVSASVGGSVWDSVRDVVRDAVSASVGGSVWDSVRDVVRDAVRGYVGGSVYGCHEAGWLSFYDYFKEEFRNIISINKIQGLIDLAKTCGWIYPTKDFCIASERNVTLNRDENGRLHSFTEAAISYADGWSIYAIHGVRIPEYLIKNPELITIEKIESEENLEIRRIMLDIFGIPRFIKESNARIINEDEFGILYCIDMKDDESVYMVKVINSTPEPDGSFKEYFLRVPPSEDLDTTNILKGDMLTAKQAVAWTFGKTDESYNPLLET